MRSVSSKQESVELFLFQIRRFCEDILDAKRTFGGRDEFVLNKVYQNSVLYHLNQIGEFTSRIDNWLEREIPDIPWKKVIGFRVIPATSIIIWISQVPGLP